MKIIKRNLNTKRRAAYSPEQERDIWVWNLEVSQYLRYLLPTTAMVVAMAASSVQAATVCPTPIQIISKDAPLLKNISSVIYQNGEFVLTETAHSYVAQLPCGDGYSIVLENGSNRKFAAGSTIVIGLGG